jgi:hypothetical protein
MQLYEPSSTEKKILHIAPLDTQISSGQPLGFHEGSRRIYPIISTESQETIYITIYPGLKYETSKENLNAELINFWQEQPIFNIIKGAKNPEKLKKFRITF